MSAARDLHLGRRVAVGVQAGAVGVGALVGATVRRARRGPRLPAWTWRLELAVEVQRAVLRFFLARDPLWLQVLGNGSLLPPSAVAKRMHTRTVDTGAVRGEWIQADRRHRGPCVLYLHGGGYVLGSVDSHREVTSRLAEASGARVFALDYRLAPQHPHPAALEDALAAYRWLLEDGEMPNQIVVAGDSAGGGLSLALMAALRDAVEPLPAAAALLCPWVDLECTSKSLDQNAPTDNLDGSMLRTWSALHRNGADPRDPAVSPVYADLTGLPPLLVHTGGAECLRDEHEWLVGKAHDAGVDVAHRVYDDLVHDWHAYAPFLPEGERAIDEIGRFVKRHTGD